MKCPKCGYLGFETTDRCRNCGYDFSLAPFAAEPDLAIRNADQDAGPPADFDLPGIARQPDALNAGALDLDRLFGADAPPAPTLTPSGLNLPNHLLSTPPPAPRRVVLPNTQVVDIPMAPRDEPVYVIDTPLPALTDDVASMVLEAAAPPVIAAADAQEATAAPAEAPVPDPSALPFEDTPHVPPPPARPPLAVRRATPEVPRGRSRTTRPVRTGSLLGLDGPPESAKRSAAAEPASLLDPPSIGARVGADVIDALLLAVIDAVVLMLTLRIAGLSMTLDDLRILPPTPFLGFLVLLAFVYAVAFTVAGGQTIGKMLTGIKVIGDDGRSVDAAGSVLRALGCMLVPLTLGLSYVPVFLTSDRRALHDRLAGTRVVIR